MQTKFLSLEIRNFLSYGNNTTIINLNFNKALLILGQNLDSSVDGQIDSNGSGKTTLLQAISYVCYDQTISDKPNSQIKVGDLINNINNKNMKVSIELSRGDKYYRIERFRKLAKVGNVAYGTGVYFLCKSDPNEEWNYTARREGGHDITNDSTGNVDDAIAEVIGLPFEIFSRIVIISATYEPFLLLGLDKQRAIIEELFGFTELSKKAEKLKDEIRTNNAELEILQKLNEQIKLEIERHNTQLTNAKLKVITWNTNKEVKHADLLFKIDTYNKTFLNVDYDAEEKKFADIQQIDAEIVKITNDLISNKKELHNIESKISNILMWDKNHKGDLVLLSNKLNQPLIFKTIEETQEFDKALKEYDDQVQKIRNVLTRIENNITQQNSSIQLLKKDLISKGNDITQLEKEIAKLDNELVHLGDSKCPYCSQQYKESQEKMAKIQQQRVELAKSVTAINTALIVIREKIAEHEQHIESYSKEKAEETNKIKAINEEKNSFIIDILGNAEIDLKIEYQKTINYQKILNEQALKIKQTNPYLKDTTLAELEVSKTTVTAAITELNDDLTLFNTGKATLVKSLVFANQRDIATAKFNILTLENNLQTLKDEVNPHLDAVTSLENIPPSELKTEKIQELFDLLEHQEFLLKVLTKKDSFVRKALVNRHVNNLNTSIKKYLTKLGLPHTVKFTQEMSVNISQFKSEIKFNNLSSGQKARVNLALAFGFRDLLQSRFGSINFCILDECLDIGLGSVGVQLAAKMIKSIAKENNLSTFLITHRDEVASMFDAKMLIELKNGFSNIIQSDI